MDASVKLAKMELENVLIKELVVMHGIFHVNCLDVLSQNYASVKNCKKGIGECSDKVPACNAWDIGCEITGGKPLIPESTWFWVKIILVLVGIGILLWLLRPLFGIAKNITD